ncbi:MAG TPA: hypothetical protein VLB02_01730 [Candidatus Paceibacterota bacterium]|nr:hypothetical protein [Candidatus Paceibacterota bacterium]
MTDFKWFIVIFVFLWLVWAVTGGPARYENKTNQFIEEPSAPGDRGDIYNLEQLKARQR